MRQPAALVLALFVAAALAVTTAWALDAPPTLVAQWGGFGSGPGQLKHPYRPALDGQGHIFVPEASSHRISVFDLDGRFVTAWGSWGEAPGQLKFPEAVAIASDGTVYVSDFSNDRVQVFTSGGGFLRVLGTAIPSPAPDYLPEPGGIAIDDSGHVHVASGYEINEFAADGTFIREWGTNENRHPWDIDFDPAGYFFVVSLAHVRKFDRNRVLLQEWPLPLVGTSGPHAQGIAVAPDGSVYVIDSKNGQVKRYSATGQLITQWGNTATTPLLSGVAVDDQGDIYVTEGWFTGFNTGTHRVSKYSYSPTPTVKTTWGRIKAMYR